MSYVPLRDLIVVRLDTESETTSATGFVIPTSSQVKSTLGTVLKTGPGARTPAGERLPMTVKEGDRVVLGKGSGQEIKINDEQLLIVREDDIMVVLTSK
jgi:chaperonin GroES